MDESILTSIKKLIGLDESYTAFDTDIIFHINSCFSVLKQVVGSRNDDFTITDDSAVWSDYTQDASLKGLVSEYIFCITKPIFDPPQNSFIVDAYKQKAEELIWRIKVYSDPYEEETSEEDDGL